MIYNQISKISKVVISIFTKWSFRKVLLDLILSIVENQILIVIQIVLTVIQRLLVSQLHSFKIFQWFLHEKQRINHWVLQCVESYKGNLVSYLLEAWRWNFEACEPFGYSFRNSFLPWRFHIILVSLQVISIVILIWIMIFLTSIIKVIRLFIFLQPNQFE